MLTAGARIAVVAPSGVFEPERLAQGMALVESWGFTVVEGPNLHKRRRYTAGGTEERVSDLSWAITASDIDAVWFARGGYGTAQTLSHLPWDRMDGRPVFGFSDATALFSAMYRRGVSGGVHAPVLHSLVDHADQTSRDVLRQVMGGASVQLDGRPLVQGSTVSGPVVGGNLCVLASLAGTPWALSARGCIVVLEDVGEAPYKIDRLIDQLIDSGGLDGAIGIALGEFEGCRAPLEASWTLEDVLVDKLSPLGIPVLNALPVGHGVRNHPWHVGRVGVMDASGLRQADVG